VFKRGNVLSSPGALALHCRSDSICLVKSSAEKSASLQPPAFCVGRGKGDGPVARTRGQGGWVLGTQPNLQQVAPARLVGVRKRSGSFEGVRVFANKGWVVSLCDGEKGGFECVRALQCSSCLARSSCFVASQSAWHCAPREQAACEYIYICIGLRVQFEERYRSNRHARNPTLAWNAIVQWVSTRFKYMGSISEPLP